MQVPVYNCHKRKFIKGGLFSLNQLDRELAACSELQRRLEY